MTTTSSKIQDAAVTAIYRRMPPTHRQMILEQMTPHERRAVESAIARCDLRRRANRRPWSTEKIRRLILTPGTTVTIHPGDHGGWIIDAENEGLVLTPHGWADARTEPPYYWPTQADAVEALAATL